MLYTLPVSLFGMSVSAAELPAMASAVGSESERAGYLRGRLDGGLRQIAFFVVPSAMAFLALGDVVAGALYQSGAFTRAMTVYVWAILAGSAVGLLASTMGRLYASAYYALHDTRTPLRYAVLRVALTIGLGYLFAMPLPRALGLEPRGAPRDSPPPPVSRGGSSSFCSGARSTRGSGGPVCRVLTPRGSGGRQASGPRAAWALRAALPVQGRPVASAVAMLGGFGVVYLGLRRRWESPSRPDWSVG